MPGTYCRGCGLSKTLLGVTDPRQCRNCGPLLAKSRDWCEWCGYALERRGQDPCPRCGKKAAKFFGR